MDVLTAHWPSGRLAAQTCDTPAGFGEQFRTSFEARGFTVTRLAVAAYRDQLEQARRQVQAVSGRPVRESVPVSTEMVVVVGGREETASPLPRPGQPIRHRDFGAGTVAYHLTLGEGPVAVGRGPGWEGLLLPGRWELLSEQLENLAQLETLPEFLEEIPGNLEQTSRTLEGPNILESPDLQRNSEQPQPLPRQWRMPSLWD